MIVISLLKIECSMTILKERNDRAFLCFRLYKLSRFLKRVKNSDVDCNPCKKILESRTKFAFLSFWGPTFKTPSIQLLQSTKDILSWSQTVKKRKRKTNFKKTYIRRQQQNKMNTQKLETFQFILLSEMIIKSKVPYNIVIKSV